jgi:hypothetical protein
MFYWIVGGDIIAIAPITNPYSSGYCGLDHRTHLYSAYLHNRDGPGNYSIDAFFKLEYNPPVLQTLSAVGITMAGDAQDNNS